MTPENPDYDIFISYSRDQLEWVEKNLYDRLCRCRLRSNGLRPKTFFDKSRDGVRGGDAWVKRIVQAIQQCTHFLPVYSENYFRSTPCNREMDYAFETNFNDERARFTPIMHLERGQDPTSIIGLVPAHLTRFHFLIIRQSDWFQRLCDAIGLIPECEQGTLVFLDQPTNICVNHTLPAIRVMIREQLSGKALQWKEPVTLQAEGCTLQGGLTVQSDQGVATFTGLSVSAPMARTRLTATAEGLEKAESDFFAVTALVSPPRPPKGPPPQIPFVGEAFFFASGQAVVVLHPGAVRAYHIDGRSLLPPPGEARFPGRLRLVRREGEYLALADWSGSVYLFREDGAWQFWPFGDADQGFIVPGDLVLDGHSLCVGYWSGAVWRLALGEQPARVLYHDAGIQGFAVVKDRFYVCGFDGNMWVYQHGHTVNVFHLEPSIWLVKAYEDGLLTVGDDKMYHISPTTHEVFKHNLPIGNVTAVLADVDMPVLINADGVGATVTSQLVKRSVFHTAPGAVPVSGDRAGRYCVLLNPDGSRTLLFQRKIVFSHLGGTLAVAPGGDRFALGEKTGIRILDALDFERLIGGDDGHD